MQKATLEALPLAVRNSDFSEQSSLFASIALPHCLEQTEREKKIPIVIYGEKILKNNSQLLGLDTSLFAFSTQYASVEAQIIGQNLAHVFGQIQAIAMDRFSQRQALFLAALTTLVEHFPPNCNAFGAVWLTSFGDAGLPTGGTTFQKCRWASPSYHVLFIPVPNQVPLCHCQRPKACSACCLNAQRTLAVWMNWARC